MKTHLLYLCCLFGWCATFAQQPVRFAVLTDLHIVPENANDHIFPEVMRAVEQHRPDYIFVTGDLTNQGNDVELENVYRHLQTLRTPTYILPGNHETTWSESAGKTFKRLWGADRFYFEDDKGVFCGLSTGPYMRMSDGHVKAEDLNWLDSTLSRIQHPDKPILFFCHYPMQEGLGNFTALTELLRKHRVSIAFSGHEHRFKLYHSDSIPQVICHALRSREDKVGYTIVDLKADTAFCHYYQLGNSRPDTSIVVDYKQKNCLKGLPCSPRPDRIGGIMPRGWRAECQLQEAASVFTGLALGDGSVLFGTSDGHLVCRNEDNYQLRWRLDLGEPLYSTPLIYKNLVIVGSSQNEIIAVDLTSGQVRWRIPTPGPVTCDGTIVGSELYMGGGVGTFLKIDISSGKVIWRFDGVRSNGRLQGAPAVKEGKVVFGAWDTYLYCLDQQSGNLCWKWNNGKNVDLFSPGNVVPVIADNRVLLVAPDRYLTILDLTTGKTLCRTNKFKVRESLGYSPQTGLAYAKTMDGELLSVPFPADSVVGFALSSLEIGYEHNPCVPLIADGIVYSGSRKGEIIATSAAENVFLWRFKCGNSSVQKIVQNENGEIMAILAEGTIWKFTYVDPVFVRRDDQPYYPKGLSGKQFALWPSHGFYYNQEQNRWMWQRARCFGSVEDISILSYIGPFLIPMLENAGAYVMMPRERDLQCKEVIVDTDDSDGKSKIKYAGGKNWNKHTPGGFRLIPHITDSINPFEQGSHIEVAATAKKSPRITHLPDMPETGQYAVYVSYARTSKPVKARYEVIHSGGRNSFTIDQSKGAGLFHYLGTYSFYKGCNKDRGAVVVTVASDSPDGVLSSDAIRFGGGMGNVARNRATANGGALESGVPRYAEAARYFLQYSGTPASVYSPDHFKNDYTDDYKCRGAWVNYLIKQGIEVDGVLAFHTDAGITPNDSVIGTLAICSTKKGSLAGMMSDTVSRVMTDLIQTQLTEDIRTSCNPKWTRRSLWDKPYFEAWMPEAPTMLLELLSHQNLADMRYGLDPRFRFIASRAIYKGFGRFMSKLRGEPFVVLPLSPTDFSIHHETGKRISLCWEAQADSLEPSAVSQAYQLYIGCEEEGWQKPIRISANRFHYELPEYGKRYRFKVTALNEGGESLPSEELSVCLFKNTDKPALIVNGFTRVSAPAFFDEGEKAGIAWWRDEGVPYGIEFAFVGYQYDFNRSSKWLSDDAPGWGASGVEGWTKRIAGNTFDFPHRHGAAFQRNRQSYVSCSRAAFEKGEYAASEHSMLDLIFGEQRATRNFITDSLPVYEVFTPAMQKAVTSFVHSGCALLVSGAYIASDLMGTDAASATFARETLHYKPVGNHACRDGNFRPVMLQQKLSAGAYNNQFSETIYKVEAPDALMPADSTSHQLYRYTENGLGAAIYKPQGGKIIVLGFPFETILSGQTQDEILRLLIK